MSECIPHGGGQNGECGRVCVVEFVEFAEYRGLDPAGALSVLNAQDWEADELISMPGFTVPPIGAT